jgi:flagellar basal body-associated protein FliL
MINMAVQSGGTAKEKKKGTGLLVFFLVLVIAALAAAVIVLFNKNKDTASNTVTISEPAEKRNVVINKDNVEEIIEQMAEEDKTPAGSYEVAMSTTWNFANGAATSKNAYVENVESNTNDVYFDITLAETGETIYKSPVIPIGSYLKNIALDTSLDKGSYDSVITYSLLDEEQNVLSTVSVGFTIIVEN